MHELPDARTSGNAASRHWALVVMGAWLMGSICTSVVATQNFYTIDRLLAGSPNSHFTSAVAQLGQPQARDLLRYLSSELNRLYFQVWNGAQLAFGAIVLWLLVRSTPRDAVYTGRAARAVAAMLVIVIAMAAWLTPAIVSLGRSLDFMPREPAPPGMQRFWVLHAAYTSFEMFKLLIGGFAAWWIVREAGGRGGAEAPPHVRVSRGAPAP
jgi:hypothetical protein